MRFTPRLLPGQNQISRPPTLPLAPHLERSSGEKQATGCVLRGHQAHLEGDTEQACHHLPAKPHGLAPTREPPVGSGVQRALERRRGRVGVRTAGAPRGGSRRPEEAQGGPRRLEEAHRGPRRPKEAQGGSRRPKEAQGGPRRQVSSRREEATRAPSGQVEGSR